MNKEETTTDSHSTGKEETATSHTREPVLIPVIQHNNSAAYTTVRIEHHEEHSSKTEMSNGVDPLSALAVAAQISSSAEKTAVICESNEAEDHAPPNVANKECETMTFKISKQEQIKSLRLPLKIYAMLERDDLANIISWTPSGHAWMIHKQQDFERLVMPQFFHKCTFASFIRMVAGWGFKKVMTGSEIGGYQHELFKRNHPELFKTMKRTATAQKQRLAMPSHHHQSYHPLAAAPPPIGYGGHQAGTLFNMNDCHQDQPYNQQYVPYGVSSESHYTPYERRPYSQYNKHLQVPPHYQGSHNPPGIKYGPEQGLPEATFARGDVTVNHFLPHASRVNVVTRNDSWSSSGSKNNNPDSSRNTDWRSSSYPHQLNVNLRNNHRVHPHMVGGDYEVRGRGPNNFNHQSNTHAHLCHLKNEHYSLPQEKHRVDGPELYTSMGRAQQPSAPQPLVSYDPAVVKNFKQHNQLPSYDRRS